MCVLHQVKGRLNIHQSNLFDICSYQKIAIAFIVIGSNISTVNWNYKIQKMQGGIKQSVMSCFVGMLQKTEEVYHKVIFQNFKTRALPVVCFRMVNKRIQLPQFKNICFQ